MTEAMKVLVRARNVRVGEQENKHIAKCDFRG